MFNYENLVHLVETIPSNKMHNYTFAVEEVIAVQSKQYYANTEENLGYYTIAQNEQSYRNKINELLEESIKLVNEKRTFSFLELGGGTGKFADHLITYFSKKNVLIDYTIVDVSTDQYPENLLKNTSVHFVKESFTNFALKNKKDFDFLIMQESLDMWAGKEVVLEEWESNKLPIEVYWVVIDLEKQSLIKKKEINKLNNAHAVKHIWVQIFVNKENKKISCNLEENTRIKIQLPTSLSNLLQRTKLLAVIQDYWSFSEEESKLRMGLYEESVEKSLDKIQFLSEDLRIKLQKDWDQELAKTKGVKTWIESNIVPFGLVDVTYSPDQSQLLDMALENDLEIVNYNAENIHSYNHEVFEVGEKENEIFVLFTHDAIELQFKQ